MTVQPENRSAPIVLVPGFWLVPGRGTEWLTSFAATAIAWRH